jgi:hypothetical protein
MFKHSLKHDAFVWTLRLFNVTLKCNQLRLKRGQIAQGKVRGDWKSHHVVAFNLFDNWFFLGNNLNDLGIRSMVVIESSFIGWLKFFGQCSKKNWLLLGKFSIVTTIVLGKIFFQLLNQWWTSNHNWLDNCIILGSTQSFGGDDKKILNNDWKWMTKS